MAKTRIAINGMGRIGRTLTRAFLKRSQELNIELVAVNNPGNTQDYVHLLKYDSVHGTLEQTPSLEGEKMIIGEHKIHFYNLYDPAEIPWGDHNVDIVIDATGRFKDKESLGKHKRDTVKKVIMCAPGKDLDGTFVVGINHTNFDASKHDIISNASCTTNCLAPVAKVLHDTFEIENGFMTTVHAYTSDQNLLDNSHSDMRRARAAALSMIPTTTGAARATGLVLPEVAGHIDGMSIRVPTADVSLVDLVAEVDQNTTEEEINAAFREAASGSLKGILSVSDEPLVSIDYTGNPHSSVVDSLSTAVMDGRMVKVLAWYDNEWGYSNRVIDLVSFVGERLPASTRD